MQWLGELAAFVLAWYNLPFTLALLAFIGLAALQFVGVGHEHDGGGHADVSQDLDHDVSVDHGVDHDLDHDVDHDVGHEVSHDVGHDAGHDAGHGVGGPPAWAEAMQFLGVGQAPLTMVVMVLLGGFGFFGWAMNALALGVFSPATYPLWVLAIILLVDLLVGAWFTSRVARFLGRAVPAFSSTATPLTRLVGRRGHVTSPQVDTTYGQVKVRDPGGTLITVFAVVDAGKPSILREAEVVLVEYDAARKVFVVVPSDL